MWSMRVPDPRVRVPEYPKISYANSAGPFPQSPYISDTRSTNIPAASQMGIIPIFHSSIYREGGRFVKFYTLLFCSLYFLYKIKRKKIIPNYSEITVNFLYLVASFWKIFNVKNIYKFFFLYYFQLQKGLYKKMMEQ